MSDAILCSFNGSSYSWATPSALCLSIVTRELYGYAERTTPLVTYVSLIQIKKSTVNEEGHYGMRNGGNNIGVELITM